MTANYGRNRNRVDQLYGDLQTVQLGSFWYLSVEARKGQPYGSMFGVGYQRDSATHELLLSDGVPLAEASSKKRVLGNYTPDWTGGLDNTFHYRGFDLGFLFDTRQGGNVYSVGNMWGSYSGVLAATAYRPEAGLLIKGIDKATGKENTVHVRAEDYYHSIYHPGSRGSTTRASSSSARRGSASTSRSAGSAQHQHQVGAPVIRWPQPVPLVERAEHRSRRRRSAPTNVQGFEMGQMPTVRSFGFQLSVTP